ncbi:caspase domain-containing protein [Rhizophagus diaphanus]|nr:caspase domain-containing protein [Rhizophagus diaphanus] [Rhizophagus sp. MUCL 43196]
MSVHKETKTYTSPDGTTTTTTTTTSYSSSSSSGNIPKDFQEFTSHFNEDPFSSDFFKKYVENSVPSHGQIKKVKYHKQEQPNDDLPDDYSLFVKPSEKVDFQTSTCTGRKRAVLIGINYYHSEYQLRGCINDVNNIKKFLTGHYGFEESNMKILTDEQSPNSELFPTRENIIKAIKWLVHDPQENDSYFFHYSGHGGQVKDDAGDEEDGFDETIMPVDFMTNGQIIDDELHALMVAPLPKGVRLTVIFDCCHSGTVLDLPYVYSTRGVVKESNILSLGSKSILNAGFSYIKGGVIKSFKEIKNAATEYQKIRRKNIETKGSPADIIMFSGCKDEQTSADAQMAGEQVVTGAMSHALVTSLNKNAHPTYQELLNSIREVLKTKYAQKPQLSASHVMNMSDKFTM